MRPRRWPTAHWSSTAERTTADLTADLVARPGIGPWTAGYVAMRLLADPDVLLTGDLVIRAGAMLLGLPGQPAELARYSSTWHPYRSYAGMHLWKVALDEAARKKADARTRKTGQTLTDGKRGVTGSVH